jgi:hypothetical protein
MLAHGSVFAVGRRTHVDRDAIAAMEQLDGTRGDPRPQRVATCTATSTLALSRGFLGRAGTIAVS